jgi:hypothetical protein
MDFPRGIELGSYSNARKLETEKRGGPSCLGLLGDIDQHISQQADVGQHALTPCSRSLCSGVIDR